MHCDCPWLAGHCTDTGVCLIHVCTGTALLLLTSTLLADWLVTDGSLLVS